MSMRRSAASDPPIVATADTTSQFAADVAYYLTLNPRQLPSKYFYDPLGSALFNAICELPWYPITRAERRLLGAHGREMFEHAAPVSRIVELGPGNGEKLATLVRTAPPARGPLDVHLIDVSAAALSEAGRALDALDDIRVVNHATTYEAGLAELAVEAQSRGRTIVLFLGSNIGNFDPPGADAFLRTVRSTLGAGDLLLVGADLVKPEDALLAAYDDPLGVTAAFNLNLLVRINRELGGNFSLDGFAHRAVWNVEASRVEMHLVCTRRQQVRVPAAGLDLAFEEGDAIWTESSYKYRLNDLGRMLERAGFSLVQQWEAPADGFALTLGRSI